MSERLNGEGRGLKPLGLRGRWLLAADGCRCECFTAGRLGFAEKVEKKVLLGVTVRGQNDWRIMKLGHSKKLKLNRKQPPTLKLRLHPPAPSPGTR